jgi:DNA polymerase III subunit beta
LGSFGLAKGVILPRKGLAELKKLLGSGDDGVVSIGFRENMGLVMKDRVELFMRLIDGDFPDYTKVIPKGNQNIARIEHDEFLQALRRVSIISSELFQMTLPCILMSSQDPAETQEKFYEDLPKYDSKNSN